MAFQSLKKKIFTFGLFIRKNFIIYLKSGNYKTTIDDSPPPLIEKIQNEVISEVTSNGYPPGKIVKKRASSVEKLTIFDDATYDTIFDDTSFKSFIIINSRQVFYCTDYASKRNL